jgi:hypothetical protein
MKTALVIVNGIKFPYFLADHAIAWAKREQGKLHALFLTSGEEMPEGYVFPSDIDLAETLKDTTDSEKDSNTIIRSLMKMLDGMATTEGVTCDAERLNDASLEQVLEKTKQAAILFIAPGYGETAMQAVTDFQMQELIDQAACPVEVVKEIR